MFASQVAARRGTTHLLARRAKVTGRYEALKRGAQMAHTSQMSFIGQYASVADASADYDSVAAAHDSGAIGHVEAAVVARDVAGTLTLGRHSKMGGIHVAHGPSDELKAGTQYVERGSVALLVISTEDDTKAVDTAVTRATARVSQPVEHVYLGGSDVGFASGPPSDEVGGAPATASDSGEADTEPGPEERLV
jgi:hypothetical protein